MKNIATVILCFMSMNGALLQYAHATSCTDLTDRTAAMAREVPSDDTNRRSVHRSHDDDRVEYNERSSSADGRRRSAD